MFNFINFIRDHNITYFALPERCNQSVCMSVHSHISKTTWPNFTKFSVHVTCGCGSVVPLQQCYMLSTYSFVNDAIFSHIRAYVAYGEAYSWGMSVSNTESTELQHVSYAPALPSGDWYPSTVSLATHTQWMLAWLWKCTTCCTRGSKVCYPWLPCFFLACQFWKSLPKISILLQ